MNQSSEYIFFDISPTASCAGRAPLSPPHQNPPSSPPTAALPQSRCINRGEKTCWSPFEVSRWFFPLRCCFNGKYFLSSFRLQSCHWLAQFQILTQIIFAQLEKQSALPKNGFSRISERFEKLPIFFYFASRKKPRTTKYTNVLKSWQKKWHLTWYWCKKKCALGFTGFGRSLFTISCKNNFSCCKEFGIECEKECVQWRIFKEYWSLCSDCWLIRPMAKNQVKKLVPNCV